MIWNENVYRDYNSLLDVSPFFFGFKCLEQNELQNSEQVYSPVCIGIRERKQGNLLTKIKKIKGFKKKGEIYGPKLDAFLYDCCD